MSLLSNAEGRQPHRRLRVAFFGGSFDPPHLGHLEVARAAQAALGLDTVLFAPVGEQPLKPQGSTAAFAHRLAMTRLAIANDPSFAVSLADEPKSSGAPNYTFDTLLALREQLPSDGVLFCLMGADAFALLRRWHRAAEIPFVAPLIVASRSSESLSQLNDLKVLFPEGLILEPLRESDKSASQFDLRRYTLRNPSGQQSPFYLLPGLDIDISASDIRARARDHAPLSAQLPTAVSEYIRAHGLYS
jgi:nicotinate-nucleotide adenylyltransferase